MRFAIGPSTRDYVDNRWFLEPLGPDDVVTVPTGIALFANQYVDDGSPPREWAERLYNVVRWTPMSTGGHFAAAEEPELVARDIAAQRFGDRREGECAGGERGVERRGHRAGEELPFSQEGSRPARRGSQAGGPKARATTSATREARVQVRAS